MIHGLPGGSFGKPELCYGPALDSILALKQNLTGGAFEALTAGTGDSFAIRSYAGGSRAWLLEAWGGNSATKCEFRVRSPRLHDNVQGIRMEHQFNPTTSVSDGDPQMYLPPYIRQPLYAVDTLTVEANGTANDDVDLVLLVYYEDLPGIAANLRTFEEISSRAIDQCGVLVTPTAGTTNNYGTSVTLTSTQDLLKSDTEYAIFGFTTDLPFTSLGIRGTDTGNMRVAAPGHWDSRRTAGWFIDLAIAYGLPLIPVIHSNNKGGVLIDAVSASNAATVPNVSLLLAELQ